MTFQATLDQAGKTATGIRVPPEIVEALGSGRQPAVKATIGRHTYRSTIAVRKGVFLLPVSAENRDAAGVTAGDLLDVSLELDTEPRTVDVPVDLAAALAAAPDANAFYDTLTPGQKKWYVHPILDAKKPETREARIVKAIGMLREGCKR